MFINRGFWTAAFVLSVFITAGCATTYAQGRYPDYPYPRGGSVRAAYPDPAYNRGFDEGYRQGLDAARDGDRYDVRRESWYRDGERGYDRRYGSRNEWRQVYRSGFTQGYDRGYREGRYQINNRGPYRRY